MYKLTPTFQKYHWGKLGSESEVYQLIEAQGEATNNTERYAELWMGAHVKSPSVFSLNGENSENLYNLAPKLPFLLKVLSVDTALSIQAHPNKQHAEELHANFPDVYKDPNHKPEMCIALTKFEGLCGFRKLDEITHFLRNVPKLAEICQIQEVNNNQDLR